MHGNKWIMFFDPSDIALDPSKLGKSNTKLGSCRSIKLSLVPWMTIIVVVRIRSWTYVAIPQHGPLSLYTTCEGPSIGKKNRLLFPMYGQHIIIKDLEIFYGHDSWSICKAVMSSYLQHRHRCIYSFTAWHSISSLQFHLILISLHPN